MAKIIEYELNFWIRPDINPEDAENVSKIIQDKLIENGFSIIFHNNPILKSLAYPINKQNHGYFSNIIFSLNQGNLDSIKEIFKFNDDILRYMITRKEVKPEILKRRMPRWASRFPKKETVGISNKEETQTSVSEVELEKALQNNNLEEPEQKKPELTKPDIDLEELDKKLNELLQ